MGEYIEPFDKEFLKRTQLIINHADLLKYNVTLIMNCMLSLVCLPIERSSTEYHTNPNKYDHLFSDLCLQIKNMGVLIEENPNNTPDKQILKCLRNGIAHIQMTPINRDGEISGVELIGSTTKKRTQYTCKFIFDKNQVVSFTNYMVEKYLQI